MADTLTKSLHVEVISPDGAIFAQDDVDMVVARAEDGEFAIMKGHLPLAAALEMSVVRIKKGAEETRVAVFGGFLENAHNKVNVVAPLAELADNIDVARAEAAKKRAETRLASHDADVDMDRARYALMRAITRINATKKSM